MTITFAAPAATVVTEHAGFTDELAAVTAAAKAAGYTSRGGRYYDENGVATGLRRAEAALIFRGYRWIARRGGRFYVTVPASL